MRVLVTGSRDWHCPALAHAVVMRLRERYGPGLVVVHGAARGVDQSFADACEALGVQHEPHPADWSLGRRAGPERNAAMVALGAGLCIAVSRDIAASRGTRGCARLAIAAGIPTWLIEGDDARPVRLTADRLAAGER